MKQRLLFLMMAFLLPVTMVKAQTATLSLTINGETANAITRTYQPGTSAIVTINKSEGLTLAASPEVEKDDVVQAEYANGGTGLMLTFKNKGTSKVTVKTDDGTKSATVTVTIKPKELVLKLESDVELTLGYEAYTRIVLVPTSSFKLEGVYRDQDVTLTTISGSGNELTCTFPSADVGTVPVAVSNYKLDGADKGNYDITPPSSTIVQGKITKSSQQNNLDALTFYTERLAAGYIKFNITAKGGVSPTYEVTDNALGLVENPTFTSKGNNLWEVSFKLLKADDTHVAKYKIRVPSSTNYEEGTVDVELKVSPPTTPNTFIPATWEEPNPKIIYGASHTMSFRTADNAQISYSGNSDEVIISGNQITFKKAGCITIGVKAAQTTGSAEATTSVIFNIQQKELTVGNLPSPVKTWDSFNTINPAIDWSKCSLSGILFSDDVSLDGTSANLVYSETAASTNNIPITISTAPVLSGDKKDNYTLKTFTMTGRINKANQPDLFLNYGKTPKIIGVVGGSWDYSNIMSATDRISIPITVTRSNTTALTDNPDLKTIGFAATGTDMSVTFKATGDANHNDGTVTIKFDVKAANTMAINVPSSLEGKYKSTPVPVNITASYSDGTTEIPVSADKLKLTPRNTAIATVSGSGTSQSPFKINFLKVGSTIIDVEKNDDSLASIIMPSTSFNVTVTPMDLPIQGVTVENREFIPGNKSVKILDTNWAAQQISLSGTHQYDLVQYTATSTNHPTFTYEDDQTGTGKKIDITNVAGCLSGDDAGNYKLVVNETGTITKAFRGNLGLGADDAPSDNPTKVKKTVKFGSSLTLSPPQDSVFESAVVRYAPTTPTGNAAYFPASNIGTVILNQCGTVDLIVTAGETTNYQQKVKTIQLEVTRGDQVFNIAPTITQQFNDGPFYLSPNAKETPTYTYTVESGNDVIENIPSTGMVTPKKAGTARVSIQSSQTTNYLAGLKVVDITITDGVAITAQPEGATICEGGTHIFSVTVVGSGAHYQWYKGSTTVGTDQNVLYVLNAKATDSGSYWVRVTNGTQTVDSERAALVVSSAVSLTTPLSSTKTVCSETRDSLKVVASGNNLTYQWYHDGALMAGKDGPELIFPVVARTDAGVYRVEISGACEDGGVPVMTASTCTLTVAISLPRLKADILTTDATPRLIAPQGDTTLLEVTKAYTIRIGESANPGYEDVDKYTWSYDKSNGRLAYSNTNKIPTNTFTTISEGTGTIRIDLENYCQDKNNPKYIPKPVKIYNPLAVDNIGSANIKVYPNPLAVNEPLSIDLGGDNSAQVYIYNVTGSLVFNTKLVSQVTNLPVNLKPGIYMVKIVTPNGKTVHHKFIVK